MKANKIIFYLGTCIQTLMEKEAASLLHIWKMGVLWLDGKNTDNFYCMTGLPYQLSKSFFPNL